MITTISRRTLEAPAYPLTVGVIKYKSVTVKLTAVTCPSAACAPGKQGVPYHHQETPLVFLSRLLPTELFQCPRNRGEKSQ